MRPIAYNQIHHLSFEMSNAFVRGVVVVWCGGFITDYKTTPTKDVLSCFGLLVGLWQ
jgi:hypothetical protein